eukprot:458068-Pyramimonas_sp.AAC.1
MREPPRIREARICWRPSEKPPGANPGGRLDFDQQRQRWEMRRRRSTRTRLLPGAGQRTWAKSSSRGNV